MQITPAILPHSFEELQEKLSRVEGIASLVQIDLCDGVFGREVTWLPDGTETLPSGFSYEFDVMVNDWRPVIAACVSLGASRIVLHVDSMTEDEVRESVTSLLSQGITCGISVSNDESVERHASMLRIAQPIDLNIFAQVMGIRNVGEQGQFFDDTVPARIIELKKYMGDVSIQVDGAMNPTNAPKVIESGAETLVVGSYIFGDTDPATAYARMSAL